MKLKRDFIEFISAVPRTAFGMWLGGMLALGDWIWHWVTGLPVPESHLMFFGGLLLGLAGGKMLEKRNALKFAPTVTSTETKITPPDTVTKQVTTVEAAKPETKLNEP